MTDEISTNANVESAIDRLAQLKKLHDEGALSTDEFATLKAQLVSTPAVTTNGSAKENTKAQIAQTPARKGAWSKISTGLAIAILIGIAALSIFGIISVSSHLPITVELVNVQNVQAIKITNVGTEPIKITAVQFNGRSDCKPLLINGLLGIPMPFNPGSLREGEAMAVYSTCLAMNIVRVGISTDHGDEEFHW